MKRVSNSQFEKELYSVLGYKEAGLSIDKVSQTVNYYITLLQHSQIGPLYGGTEVLVTNKAPLNPQFQDREQKLYKSTIKNVDFSNRTRVVQDINNFVRNETHFKIFSIVNHLDTTPSAMLIDFIVFRGFYEKAFPIGLTKTLPFYTQDGAKNMPFMQTVQIIPFLDKLDFQAILIPYSGGNVGLLVLVPSETYGLKNLERDITPKRIVDILPLLQPQRTRILLPRFKFECGLDLSSYMVALGAQSVYDGSGNFSGMTDSDSLAVSYTLVKSVIDVYEGHSRSSVNIDLTLPINSTVLANRPFMFAVVDINLKMLWFMGRFLM